MQYLMDNWHLIDPDGDQMKFDLVAGVSVGSLNGVLTAANKFDKLTALWGQVAEQGVEVIYTSDFIDTKSNSDKIEININFKKLFNMLLPDGVNLFRMIFDRDDYLEELGKKFMSRIGRFKSIADNSPLREKLAELVTIDSIKDCTYMCGFVSLDDGKYYGLKHTDFTQDKDFRNGILASTNMPVIWDPIPEINTIVGKATQSVDGGIRNVSPLGDVIDEINKDKDSEYLLIIINCNCIDVATKDYTDANIVQIALRSLEEIAINEIFNNDLKEFIRINDMIEQVKDAQPGMKIYHYDYEKHKRTDKVLKSFKTIVIQPAPGVLGDTLVANRQIIDTRLDHGKQKAQEAVAAYQKAGSKFRFHIT